MIRIKYFILLLAFVCLSAGVGNAQTGQAKFFESLYDIPVMKGLVEVPEMAISFDKAGGRISEAGATAEGLAKPQILSFYNEALVQMGWKAFKPQSYVREDEKLQISITPVNEKNALNSNTSLLIKFTLEPL